MAPERPAAGCLLCGLVERGAPAPTRGFYDEVARNLLPELQRTIRLASGNAGERGSPAALHPKLLGICCADRQDRRRRRPRQRFGGLEDGREERVASYVLAIDQGTTSTRAMLFRADTSVAALPSASSRSTFPPTARSSTSLRICGRRPSKPAARAARGRRTRRRHRRHRHSQSARDHADMEPQTGRAPIARSSGRTAYAGLCARLEEAGHEAFVTAKTGLLLDPYFSGRKLAWLLQNVANAADLAARGKSPSGRSTPICCGD